MTGLRDLIQQLADELDHYKQLLTDDRREAHPLAVKARAYLAQQEPVPAPVDLSHLSDEEFAALAPQGYYGVNDEPEAVRRPKPPSLKEQALEQLDGIATVFLVSHGGNLVCDTVRRALEALPDND